MVSKACRRNPKLRRHKLLVEVWEDTLEFGLLDFDSRYVVVTRFISPISVILATRTESALSLRFFRQATIPLPFL
jgi:hypothetical protein